MGGRGTYAIVIAPKTQNYVTVGKLHGVKILEGINGKHGLPECSKTSKAYIQLDNGKFKKMRIYRDDGSLYLEIAYDNEPNLGKGMILHYHIYGEEFSKTKINPFYRTDAALLTPELIKEYGKFIIGRDL